MTGLLPLEPTPLLGRENDAEEVRLLLGRARLLTLAGAGGSGKTRLALRVARDVQAQHPDVWWVELASSTDPALVVKRVAAALGVSEAPGRPITPDIIEFLSDRDALLVVDNCEHLVVACAELADRLLAALPRLRMLATSREPLGVLGETTWQVPPLAIPEPGRALTVAELLRYAAAALFVQRATDDDASYQIIKADVPALAQLCRQLDGMPLALELAAARARVLSVSQIADRLGSDPNLLADRGRGRHARHRTLEATMQWSHGLLDDDEQRLFRRLAVFSGTFGLDAVERVAADDGHPARVLDRLTGLVDKSLVVVMPHTAGPARYRLLETMRRFAFDRQVDAGEERQLRDAHVDWILAFGQEARSGLAGDRQRQWIARLEADHDNITAALDHLAATDQTGRGLRLLGQLGRYWWYAGRFAEGAGWIERFLARPDADRYPSEKAGALQALGLACFWHESSIAGVDRACRRFEEAVALYRQLGDDHGLSAALCDLGTYWKGHGGYEQAESVLRESAQIAHGAGLAQQAAAATNVLGVMAAYRGDRLRARELLEQSMTVLRLGTGSEEATRSQYFLACIDCDEGDTASARTRFTELAALEAVQSLPYTSGFALDGMARLAAAEQLPEKAARLAGAAQARHETLGTSAGPTYAEYVEHGLRSALQRLGPERAARAHAQGRRMAVADAIAEGLTPPPRPGRGLLSEREAEILHLAAQGLADNEIAAQLTLSPRTVGGHLGSVYRKLGVTSRTAAVRAGQERRLLQAP